MYDIFLGCEALNHFESDIGYNFSLSLFDMCKYETFLIFDNNSKLNELYIGILIPLAICKRVQISTASYSISFPGS